MEHLTGLVTFSISSPKASWEQTNQGSTDTEVLGSFLRLIILKQEVVASDAETKENYFEKWHPRNRFTSILQVGCHVKKMFQISF